MAGWVWLNFISVTTVGQLELFLRVSTLKTADCVNEVLDKVTKCQAL